jgi:hypothetical protein
MCLQEGRWLVSGSEAVEQFSKLPRFNRFCYTSPETHYSRRLLPYQLRDGDAALEFFEALRALGFRYGHVFINWPLRRGEEDTSLATFRELQMTERELLLLTTRPPLSDHLKRTVTGKNGKTMMREIKKPLRKSGTALEQMIFDGLERYVLGECSRTHVRVHPNIAPRFSHGFENRTESEFYCTRPTKRADAKNTMFDAAYKALHGRGGFELREEDRNKRSAGYLLHLPLPGFRLLAIWGASGVMTFVFSFLLGAEHPRLLKRALADPSRGHFAMAEIEMTTPIPERPPTMDFCRAWRVEIAAQCDFDVQSAVHMPANAH